MDAGCVVHQRLHGVRYALHRYGFYSPLTGTTVGQLTHVGCLRWLGATDELARRPMRAGTVVGFSVGTLDATHLAAKWRASALEPACIAPEGSDRTNHRQDQSVLSVLLHQSALSPRTPSGFLGFSVHQDID
jgi:hypothetical protein